MKSDTFRFRQFSIRQHDLLMKVHTDGVLLGTFSSQFKATNAVEIGCGLGYISLMLAQAGAKHVLAIDKSPLAIEMATQNFSSSPYKHVVKAECISLQQWVLTNKQKFDLIVSNPPYYKNSYLSPFAHKVTSRHDLEDWKTWLLKSANHLTDHGEIHLIYPFSASYQLESEFFLHDLFIHRYWIIKSHAHQLPILRIMAFGFQKCKFPSKKVIIIHKSSHQFTDQYKTLVQDYLFL